jgi:hypothetical protein
LFPKKHDSNKVMGCTHKIKSKKEYGFLKQKKNWYDSFSFFCFKKPYPFQENSPLKKTFLDWLPMENHGYKKNKKIKKKKAKVSSRFTKKQVQASGF